MNKNYLQNMVYNANIFFIQKYFTISEQKREIEIHEFWILLLLKHLCNAVEPRYKVVGYNKTLLYNKVILLVPALYISLFFYPDIMRNL